MCFHHQEVITPSRSGRCWLAQRYLAQVNHHLTCETKHDCARHRQQIHAEMLIFGNKAALASGA